MRLRNARYSISDNMVLVIGFLVFLAIRSVLIGHLPIYAIVNSVYDDKLMVDLTNSMLQGQWLGAYTSETFVKGIGFPLFLAISRLLGLSYLTASNVFYAMASLIFVIALKPLMKKRWQYLLLLFFLMFNPASFGLTTLQRVYRNGITMGQVLIVLGCLSGLFIRYKEKTKKLLPYALLGGIALAWLWNTREDGIWIIPFVIVCGIITIVFVIHPSFNQESKAIKIKKSLVVVSPMVILLASILIISSINYAVYGTFVTTELNAGSFPDAMKALYAIDQEGDDLLLNDRISIPANNISKAYEVSPTLKSIQPELDEALNSWGKTADSHQNDGQLENGWFFWAFRMAAGQAGYYDTPAHANSFYEKVAEEINTAFKDGRLNKRWTMPSALMGPWRQGYGERLVTTGAEAILYVSTFDGVSTELMDSPDDGTGALRYFEVTTGNLAVSKDLGNTSLIFGNASAKLCNIITTIYQKCGLILGILSLIAYVFLTIRFIRKRGEEETTGFWLTTTGILASMLVLILGVSYNEIASCPSINYMYLSGAYPLYIAFVSISIGWGVNTLLNNRTNKKEIKD